MRAIQILKMGGLLDSQIVTSGVSGSLTGFSTFASVGSIVTGNSKIYGGAAITELHHNLVTGLITFRVSGVFANSGWTTVNINGTALLRAAGTFTNPSYTQWTWINANLFGINGSIIPVSFT